MKSNRHFYEAEDILSEFQQTARNEADVRISYPLRFFHKLPKETLTKSDFPQLLKEVSIPKFEPKVKKLRKSRDLTNIRHASWGNGKVMYGKLAAIRDIHAQLLAGMRRK